MLYFMTSLIRPHYSDHVKYRCTAVTVKGANISVKTAPEDKPNLHCLIHDKICCLCYAQVHKQKKHDYCINIATLLPLVIECFKYV